MITNDDLLKEVSFESLTQLSDLNATGFLDQGVIDDAIDDSISLLGILHKRDSSRANTSCP